MRKNILLLAMTLLLAFLPAAQAQEKSSGKIMLNLSEHAAGNGVYAVSVVDAGAVTPDTTTAGILSALLLESELRGRVEQPGYYFRNDDARTREHLDLLMLTQGWRRYDMDSILCDTAARQMPHAMQTEQVITGRVKGTFGKIKQGQLRLFIPRTGFSDTLSLGDSQRFALRGLDYVDGTTILLQALNRRESDNFIELVIDEPHFPDLTSLLAEPEKTVPLPPLLTDESYLRTWRQLNSGTFMLPEVKVKGRKLKPMNRRRFMPDRGIPEGSPLFETVKSLNVLLIRLGLRFGMAEILTEGGLNLSYRPVIGFYSARARRFVPVTIRLNDDKIDSEEHEMLYNLDPLEIRQMEYFLPSNYEAESTVLYIYTKSPTDISRFRIYKPLSMKTVRHIGYKQNVEFYMPDADTQRDDPYLNKRSTRYWNPAYCGGTDNEVEIYVPDSSARYVMTIEGVADDGTIVRTQKTLE